MDKELKKAVKEVIKSEIGELISAELKQRFKQIQNQIDTVQKSNDEISRQIKDDRKDMNDITIDVAKIAKAVGVVIHNQNHQEDAVVEAVKKEAKKIPGQVEQSVDSLFQKKPFLAKLRERFFKGGEK